MLLGFRRLYASGSHKIERSRKSTAVNQMGHLTLDEVQHANRILRKDWPPWAWELAQRIFARGRINWHPRFRQQARLFAILLGVALCIDVCAWIFSSSSTPQLRSESTDIAAMTSSKSHPSSDETTRYQDQPTRANTPLFAQTMQIQTRFVQLGYLVGRPDGVWGPRSRNALRAFKSANGLVVDDFMDETTIAILL